MGTRPAQRRRPTAHSCPPTPLTTAIGAALAGTLIAADLGLRLHFAQGYVEPTIYYASINNKSVNVYDPTVALNDGQNIGNGHLAGVQLAAGREVHPSLNLFGSASWRRAVFDENLRTAATSPLHVAVVGGPAIPPQGQPTSARYLHNHITKRYRAPCPARCPGF